MTVMLENATTFEPPTAAGHYLVSHGKSGALGSFATLEPLCLRRGDRVIIDSPRGREVGTVLCPATVRQSRLLGAVSASTIVRSCGPADEAALEQARALEQPLFEAGRRLAGCSSLNRRARSTHMG